MKATALSFAVVMLVLPLAAIAQTADVRVAQAHLTVLGYDPGPIDGRWGAKTAEALLTFQRDQAWPETGQLDPSIMAQLGAARPLPTWLTRGWLGEIKTHGARITTGGTWRIRVSDDRFGLEIGDRGEIVTGTYFDGERLRFTYAGRVYVLIVKPSRCLSGTWTGTADTTSGLVLTPGGIQPRLPGTRIWGTLSLGRDLNCDQPDHEAPLTLRVQYGAAARTKDGHLWLYDGSQWADVNAGRGDRATELLVVSSQSGHLDMVDVLLDHGADVNAASAKDDWTPLGAGSYGGHLDIVDALLEHGADVNAAGGDGWRPLLSASNKGHLEVVNALLEHGADVNASLVKSGGKALMLASERGHLGVVDALLEHGADVNASRGDGGTALMSASMEGHLAVVDALLEHGADVNAGANNGATALLVASQAGHLDVVATALEHGADVDASLNNGGTVLMLASDRGHADVVGALLEHGADVNVIASNGLTALQAAEGRNHEAVVELLLKAGAKR